MLAKPFQLPIGSVTLLEADLSYRRGIDGSIHLRSKAVAVLPFSMGKHPLSQ